MKLERKLTAAKKYILDDEMTRLVAYMSLQPPEYFLKNLSSCRLPYDFVWFQWDQHVMLKAYQEEGVPIRSEEHTSELQSRQYLVCRLLLEKKKKKSNQNTSVLFLLTY